MKTSKATWLKWLFLCVTLVGVFPAHAYYDPGAQRWLNRDPKRELGFEMVRIQKLPHSHIWVRLYRFVLNNPVKIIDALGLGEGTGPFNGVCCNSGKQREWALVSGNWIYLDQGECTTSSIFVEDQDCDGMTCNGGFYAVSDIGSADCKPGKDPGKCNLNPKNKWTPNKQGPKAEPPVWDPKTKKGRGSKHGNTPPGYSYVD